MSTHHVPAKLVLFHLASMATKIHNSIKPGDSADGVVLDVLNIITCLQKEILSQNHNIPSLSAHNPSLDRLVSLFQLIIPTRADAMKYEYKPPTLAADPPLFLATALTKLDHCNYDNGFEMAGHTSAEILLMEVRLSIIDYTSPPPVLDVSDPQPIRIFPELDLSLSLTDPTTMQNLEVRGRADWAFGYGMRDDFSRYVVAVVVAKTPALFSGAYLQLLTCLAIMRRQRLLAGKDDWVVRGFFTDGVQYRFVMIDEEGIVMQSRLYETFLEGQLATIFQYVREMMNFAMDCSSEMQERSCLWD